MRSKPHVRFGPAAVEKGPTNRYLADGPPGPGPECATGLHKPS